MNMQTDSKQSERPARFAPTGGYATAVWLLECGAEDRDKTAEKLRDWADERGSRSPADTDVLDKLWREANELRAAAELLKSHTYDYSKDSK